MKGLVIPSKVRMNQEGWTIMNILRFFFSLWDKIIRKQELKTKNNKQNTIVPVMQCHKIINTNLCHRQ